MLTLFIRKKVGKVDFDATAGYSEICRNSAKRLQLVLLIISNVLSTQFLLQMMSFTWDG
jgi:hypothetical protein